MTELGCHRRVAVENLTIGGGNEDQIINRLKEKSEILLAFAKQTLSASMGGGVKCRPGQAQRLALGIAQDQRRAAQRTALTIGPHNAKLDVRCRMAVERAAQFQGDCRGILGMNSGQHGLLRRQSPGHPAKQSVHFIAPIQCVGVQVEIPNANICALCGHGVYPLGAGTPPEK